MAEGTPLDRKLGIKPGHVVTLRHAPPGWTPREWALPDVEMVEDDIAGADVVLASQGAQDLTPWSRRRPVTVVSCSRSVISCWVLNC